MREVLETLLTAEGYRVDLAKTGEEGLEAYGRRAFDVVERNGHPDVGPGRSSPSLFDVVGHSTELSPRCPRGHHAG